MDQTFIRQTLIDRMRRHGESLEQAASSFARGMDVPMSELTATVESIRREGRRNMLLDSPPGVYDLRDRRGSDGGLVHRPGGG